MQPRTDIRNIAIIAHVDHGKTTLVDALLRQSGTFAAHEETIDRVMDAGLERERGITILAKNTSVRFGDVKINIIDTPGHADFGGEVERGLSMVDGVLLLVDASEGPLPQTRFVLRKALAARLPVILVVNKIDRPDARIAEVVDEVYALFFDEDADESQIDFPIVYTNARLGTATLDAARARRVDPAAARPDRLAHAGARCIDPAHPFQAQVANLDSSPYLGRLALCRVRHGEIGRGATVAWCRRDGTITRTRLTELLVAEGLERVPAERAGPGEIIAVAGLDEVMIGETIADPDDPQPLPLIVVDEPSLSVTIATNTGPLAGRSGSRLTARMIKDRLDRELLGNVGLRVYDTDRPDTWEVQGRGEMQFAILAEMMRREGHEITIGKPRVVTRTVSGRAPGAGRAGVDRRARGVLGRRHPGARAAQGPDGEHDQPRHRLGAARAPRARARPARLPLRVPDRDARHGPAAPRLRGVRAVGGRDQGPAERLADRRPRGRRPATRSRTCRRAAVLFVDSGEEVYEGMIVGENSRSGDLDVNITKAKQMTNVRSNADVLVRLNPPHRMSLDQAIEYIQEGECVEVTPAEVRLRKAVLSASERSSQRSKAARGK